VTAVESYAREMRTDERAFYGYYWWQVLYRKVDGTYLLPVGYPRVRAERLLGWPRGPVPGQLQSAAFTAIAR
jgi:hypothetical protein